MKIPKINIQLKFLWTLAILSMLLSWSVNHSFVWAILHFFIYILYIPYWFLYHSDVPKMLLDLFTESPLTNILDIAQPF
jgi:hypothetical protein